MPCNKSVAALSSSRRSYTNSKKLEVVELAKHKGNRAAGREHGVHERQVREWRLREDDLKKQKTTAKAAGRGQRCRWPDLEKNMASWITAQQDAGRTGSTVAIRLKASVMAKEMGHRDFTSSPSWCFRFLKRNNLSIRARTDVGQKLPDGWEEKMPRKKNWRKGLHLKAAAVARRILKASEMAKALEEKEAELKPTLQKLMISSGSQTKVNLKEMSQEANREQVKGMPRFGIELVHLSNPEGLGVDEDLPLPGLHGPSPPPAQVSPDRERALRTQRVKQPRVASGSPVSLEDPNLCHGHNGEVVHRAEKRKRCNTDSGLPGVSADHSRKRQKVKLKSDSGQVGQLLAVSLKEEELSRSMLALDTSLIQARCSLQAAFTKVQQLLLAKQQVVTEINCLRARRVDESSLGNTVF
ncbi:zinc finger protein 106-like isoform X2 [Hypomesus transpacificus]|uniref:zinc finger protein 106-like isoform X2 n=1 Tax=Hypomesus transpacificus TaxID=137520 RepID=UPI001F0726C6|nr:zinc finger protein 106-like isoform X2 [Hypomesus transpacificus]